MQDFKPFTSSVTYEDAFFRNLLTRNVISSSKAWLTWLISYCYFYALLYYLIPFCFELDHQGFYLAWYAMIGSRRATRNTSGQASFLEIRHFDKYFIYSTPKKAPQENIWVFFFLDDLKTGFQIHPIDGYNHGIFS